MNATFFANQAEFRKWFEKHHKSEKELLVGLMAFVNRSITKVTAYDSHPAAKTAYGAM